MHGLRIALPEDRDIDRLTLLLEAEGATPVRYTLTSTWDPPDPAPVTAWLRSLALGAFDDVVFLSGEGVTRLLQKAQVLGIESEVLRSLARARRIARGPKAAQALAARSLPAHLASSPSVRALAEDLRTLDLAGHRVGLQLFGDDPCGEVVAALATARAHVDPVAPYRYGPANDAEVALFIDQIAAQEFAAVGFTVPTQVAHLLEVAERRAGKGALVESLARVHVLGLGEAVSSYLTRSGIRVACRLTRPSNLLAFTNELAVRLREAPLF